MDEFRLIERFFRRDSKSSEVVVGIGDDGAVVKTCSNEQTVLVTDTLVAGVQGQLWSETLTKEHYIDSMINPRLAALAEVAWSSNNRRNWSNFRSALFQSMQLTTKLGWNYHDF